LIRLVPDAQPVERFGISGRVRVDSHVFGVGTVRHGTALFGASLSACRAAECCRVFPNFDSWSLFRSCPNTEATCACAAPCVRACLREKSSTLTPKGPTSHLRANRRSFRICADFLRSRYLRRRVPVRLWPDHARPRRRSSPCGAARPSFALIPGRARFASVCSAVRAARCRGALPEAGLDTTGSNPGGGRAALGAPLCRGAVPAVTDVQTTASSCDARR